MEELALSTKALANINLAPATLLEEVRQNLMMIATTKIGTVPYHREFGFDFYMLDMPLHLAQAAYSKEFYLKVKQFEPRAVIKEITYANDAENGRMVPKVKWRLKENQ